MRRRRPSALYSVLDEEDLLGGVDLTNYPDPGGGSPAGSRERPTGEDAEWARAWPEEAEAGEWSPEDWGDRGEDWAPDDDPEDWTPDDDPEDWTPDDDPEDGGWSADRDDRGRAASIRPASSGTRRGRLVVGCVGGLVVIALVARVIGGVISTPGNGRTEQVATGRGTVGALSAMSRSTSGD
jgi:hypothetical protein